MVSLQLLAEIKQVGKTNREGKVQVLFRDLLEGRESESEALVGALLSARKHKVYSSPTGAVDKWVHQTCIEWRGVVLIGHVLSCELLYSVLC